MNKVEVKFILYVSEDKTIELTEDEAKTVYYKLREMFGSDWRVVYPTPPIWIEPSDPGYPSYPYITCTTT